jgi:hypothetical protein
MRSEDIALMLRLAGRETSAAVDTDGDRSHYVLNRGRKLFGRLWRARRNLQDDRHRWDIQQRIDRLGWTGIYVGDYHTAPTWAYTIGFRSSLGAPEIIIFDLPPEVADNAFQAVFNELKAGTLVIRDGEIWRPEEAWRATWRKVHPTKLADGDNRWLGIAEAFDAVLSPETGEFEAYQLVLSDGEQRLPWEPGYDERLRPRQPALYEPAAPPSS